MHVFIDILITGLYNIQMTTPEKYMQVIEDGWIMFNKIKSPPDEVQQEYRVTETDKKRSEYMFTDTARQITEWCNKNCTGDWAMFAGKYYFKEEKDAMLFALKWV